MTYNSIGFLLTGLKIGCDSAGLDWTRFGWAWHQGVGWFHMSPQNEETVAVWDNVSSWWIERMQEGKPNHMYTVKEWLNVVHIMSSHISLAIEVTWPNSKLVIFGKCLC